MLLDHSKLECFVAVAEELHFGRAAERLCMTQPPLSRQIQLLEHALGVKLFDRDTRSVHLTAAGRAFLVDATRLLNLAKHAAITAQRINLGQSGRINVGFTTVMGFELIPKLITSAQRALPDIDIVLSELSTLDQLAALETHTIDIGFLWPLPSRRPLRHQRVHREPLVLILPADHPLAKRPRIVLDDLEGVSFVMYSPRLGRYFFDLVNGLLVAAGVVPKYVQHIGQVLTVVGLVKAGMGVSIVPASVAQFQQQGVVFRRIAGVETNAEARMAWRDDNHNPAIEPFCRFASDYFAGG